MFFNESEAISNIWVSKVHFRETKSQAVSGRPFHSLSFRLGGEVTFAVNGKRYTSCENSITFIPAHMDYVTQVQREGDMVIIHFETVSSVPEATAVFLRDRVDLKNAFNELSRQYHLNGENLYGCMSQFYAILSALCKSSHMVPRRIQQAKSQMDIQFAQPLSIASLANEAGVSEVQFRKEFKQHYGMSPLTYLKRVRMDNAKQLLQSGYYTVTDVALECGFESISYFSYEFKRLVGVSPTEYLKT